jgi:hypothetical protein
MNLYTYFNYRIIDQFRYINKFRYIYTFFHKRQHKIGGKTLHVLPYIRPTLIDLGN